MTDILNIGTSYNIKGKHSNYYYEGILFDKMSKNNTTFFGRNYIIDVKEVSDTEILSFYDIKIFYDNEIPLSDLQGDKYLVIDGRPRFGQITLIDYLKGTHFE